MWGGRTFTRAFFDFNNIEDTQIDVAIFFELKMNVKSTKFTLIIPTRERPDTLEFCLRNILDQDYQNFEVLVSDNFSQDDTKQIVSNFLDSRVSYLNTGKRISMSHNWEFALSQVTSGWVMFIGDDDGLLPNALKTLNEVIQKTGCQAVSAMNCVYTWPGHFSSSPKGELSIPLRKKELFEVRDTAEWLRKAMNGDVDYRELPWLYNGGAADIDVINKLRTPSGVFFNSINPDIFSAVALSVGLSHYAYINAPVGVNGASKHSGGTSLMTNGGLSKASPSSKFLAEENIPFHPSLIFGRSIHMMVYECYLQAKYLYPISQFDLKSQLKTSISLSPKTFRSEITNDCLKIATINNVEMPSGVSIIIRRMQYGARVLLRKIFVQRLLTIPATDLDLADVHSASVAAKQIDALFASVAGASTASRQVLGVFIFFVSFIRYISRHAAKINMKKNE